MSSTPWLKLGDRTLYLEELPALLERSQLLKPLLRRILLESCIDSIHVSEDEQRSFQQQFLSQQGIRSAEDLSAWLASSNLSDEQASRNILEALKLDRFKEDRFGADVERIFLESKDQRDRVVYSLLRMTDAAAAEEMYLRLEEGDATFTELSQEHSVGPERETGGLIGPVPLGRLNLQLSEMLRVSTPGQIWRPMEIEGFWVIVRLDKKIPAQFDKSMQQLIRDESFERWIQHQLDQFMEAFRQADNKSSV